METNLGIMCAKVKSGINIGSLSISTWVFFE